MVAIKFKANAFHVEEEENKIVLEAAVQTLCGKVVEYVDIYLPLSFKDQFTALNKNRREKETSLQNDLNDLEKLYLKRQNYQN